MSDSGPKSTRPNTWLQKAQRELARLIRQVNTLPMRPVALTARANFLFILGHMRSGSSLLCHLLCNSNDIIGFGESHNNYRRRSDLAKLLVSVRSQTGRNPLTYRYVLDKVVGAQHVIRGAVLADRRTRYVFLLREPLATIASIVAMRGRLRDEPLEQGIEYAAEHYTERLAQLTRIAQMIDDPQRCLLLTHGQMIAETSSVFGALENFLQLRAPLREDYALMPTTGQAGIGDPSPSIRLGKIDRSLPRKHVALSADLQLHLQECYAVNLCKLRETIETPGSQDRIGDTRAA